MPSLRRMASTPISRSTPYSNGLLTARGNGHRRSSGSETSNRRVLADIEWWRVTDGQCDASQDQESEDPNRGIQDVLPLDVSLGLGIPVTHVEDGVEHLSPVPLPWNAELQEDSLESSIVLPTEQFSGLSITPHTPIRRHLSLESSTSSLESTPEPAEASLESLGFSMSNLDMGFLETALLPLSQRRSHYGSLSPILPTLKFDRCMSLTDEYAVHEYADFAVSPLSSAPSFLN